jgi:hypothetical protein
MKLIIIKNNKSPVKTVFDYMTEGELLNPLPHQRKMLEQICDGIEIREWTCSYKSVLKTLSPGDYLYESGAREFIKLVGIVPKP